LPIFARKIILMRLYSTNHNSPEVSLEEAVLRGLPPDNGLYMPQQIPRLSASFLGNIQNKNLQEIAIEVCNALFSNELTASQVQAVVERAVTFEAPLAQLHSQHHVLELWHGSSMAFKDFGARFMAALMGFFLEKSQKKIKILVATSGDTGGAVAQGFHNTPNIEVVILYPSGKVSDIQEKQLTTLGGNVQALEINGTFDDCQALVKAAFLDQQLRSQYNLASANSINISRLIPQSFYYWSAYAQLQKAGADTSNLVFTVPSGNFGNLSAGLMACQMGLPVRNFIAATNANRVVPAYLETGNYVPVPSVETYSNAMDVGNPSNFVRMQLLAGGSYQNIAQLVKGYSFTDAQTLAAIRAVKEQHNYLLCPHTAVAYLGSEAYAASQPNATLISLSTAHYAKFLPVMQQALGYEPAIPERLAQLLGKQKVATSMSKHFADFKEYLMAGI
jgi:threonine synthase